MSGSKACEQGCNNSLTTAIGDTGPRINMPLLLAGAKILWADGL